MKVWIFLLLFFKLMIFGFCLTSLFFRRSLQVGRRFSKEAPLLIADAEYFTSQNALLTPSHQSRSTGFCWIKKCKWLFFNGSFSMQFFCTTLQLISFLTSHCRRRTVISSSSTWRRTSARIWHVSVRSTAMATMLRCRHCASCIIARSKFTSSALVGILYCSGNETLNTDKSRLCKMTR